MNNFDFEKMKWWYVVSLAQVLCVGMICLCMCCNFAVQSDIKMQEMSVERSKAFWQKNQCQCHGDHSKCTCK